MNIKSIIAKAHDSSFGGYPFKVIVKVEMDNKVWQRIKKSGQLGMLYGVDISNAVYRLNNAINASNPMVDDTKRAVKGIKTITLTYFDRDLTRASKLGLEVNTYRNGETIVSYNAYSVIL